jgi:hypothetical protein
MDSFHLGEIFGPELLKREFKELCLQNMHLFFENNELMLLFYKKVTLDSLRFNDMIYYTLDQYVQRYLPKYIGNFSKAEFSGDLYFGINDCGLIEGIPFCGNIDIDIIKKMCIESMNNTRGIRVFDNNEIEYDNTIVESYYSALEIDIYGLHTPNTDTLEFRKSHYSQIAELTKLEKKNQNIVNSWEKFHHLNFLWKQKLSKYAGKLLNYLINDDMRNETIQYIIKDFNTNDSYDKSKLKSIIDFFSKDSSFYVDLTLSVDYIEEIIKDPYSPIKFLISYKDHILSELKKLKPSPPILKPDSNLYLKHCNNVSNINTFLMTSNPDIKFFLIKISVKHIPNSYLEYRYNKLSPWLSRKRINSTYGPSCI